MSGTRVVSAVGSGDVVGPVDGALDGATGATVITSMISMPPDGKADGFAEARGAAVEGAGDCDGLIDGEGVGAIRIGAEGDEDRSGALGTKVNVGGPRGGLRGGLVGPTVGI